MNQHQQQQSAEIQLKEIRKLIDESYKTKKDYEQSLRNISRAYQIKENINERRNAALESPNKITLDSIKALDAQEEHDLQALKEIGITAINLNGDHTFSVDMNKPTAEERRNNKQKQLLKGASLQQRSELENTSALEKQYRLMELIAGTGGSGSGSSRTNANTKARNDDDNNNTYRPTTIKGASTSSTSTRVNNFHTDSDSEKIMKTFELAKMICGV